MRTATDEARDVQMRWLNMLLGQSPRQRRYLSCQQRNQIGAEEVTNLPYMPTAPIQDQNPNSTTFGQFYFMFDFSPMDEAMFG